MRPTIFYAILRAGAVLLILRVLVTIVLNYPDYFPAHFDSLFLQGREQTFTASYQIAFYIHILASPVLLVSGLILLSDRYRISFPRGHRRLGWVHSLILLLFVLPSSIVMACKSFGGWSAGASFIILAFATATCTILGIANAVRRRYAIHRRWMLRSYVLLCSAVLLRLISGAASLLDIGDPETAYVIASWCSWVLPLTLFEVAIRWRMFADESTNKLSSTRLFGHESEQKPGKV
ncbi:DUF2306 domain-containing protein [soil metagenome]